MTKAVTHPHLLPRLVQNWLLTCEAWIVGSGAGYLLGLKDEKPRDIDVVIPFHKWKDACALAVESEVGDGLDLSPQIGNLGSIKIHRDGWEIDFWAGDIGDYFAVLAHDREHMAVRTRPALTVITDTTFAQLTNEERKDSNS